MTRLRTWAPRWVPGSGRNSAMRRRAMSFKLSVFSFILIVLLTTSATVLAQNGGASAGPAPEEVIRGGYLIHQSTDVGYRFSELSGSGHQYDTLVNLHSGGR